MSQSHWDYLEKSKQDIIDGKIAILDKIGLLESLRSGGIMKNVPAELVKTLFVLTAKPETLKEYHLIRSISVIYTEPITIEATSLEEAIEKTYESELPPTADMTREDTDPGDIEVYEQ